MRFYAIVGGISIGALILVGTYYVTMFFINNTRKGKRK